jgi:hypothetical protein
MKRMLIVSDKQGKCPIKGGKHNFNDHQLTGDIERKKGVLALGPCGG